MSVLVIGGMLVVSIVPWVHGFRFWATVLQCPTDSPGLLPIHLFTWTLVLVGYSIEDWTRLFQVKEFHYTVVARDP